jgi:DNA-binding transcriptional ArsR family regulator
MSIKINHTLNPIYETILLLYCGYDLDKFKAMTISQLNETVSNGEEYYQKHFKYTEKYISVFQKYRISSDNDSFFFKDTSLDFFLSFVTPLFLINGFIDEVDKMNNEQLFQLLLNNSSELFELDTSEYAKLSHEEFVKTDTLMSFINQFSLSENEKWKMLLIMQKPLEYYLHFTDLVKKNFPAYKKALEAVKAPVDKLLNKFEQHFSKEEAVKQLFQQINVTDEDIRELTPTLITSSSVIIMVNSCFCGLTAENALSELDLSNKDNRYLQLCLKALSDSSKLEILSTLKVSPKYATELAIQLGLTPATVSHHMNVLLTAKLVYIEKSGGKFYYHIDENSIKEVLNQLGNLLVN